MDSAEVTEIKRHLGVFTEQIRSEVGDLEHQAGVVADQIRSELADAKRHAGVVAENLRSDIRQVAEAVAGVDGKLEREVGSLRAEMNQQFEETRAMIRLPTPSSTGDCGSWRPATPISSPV